MNELNTGVSNKVVKRGEIYYIHRPSSFNGSHEIDTKKGRPAIIVSRDEDNAHSGTVEIAYLTSGSNITKMRDTQFMLTQGKVFNSVCKTEQIHTVDKRCLGDYAGTITDEEREELDSCLLISLGIKKADNFFGYETENMNMTAKEEEVSKLRRENDEVRRIADLAVKENEELRRYKLMYFDLVNALAGNRKGD